MSTQANLRIQSSYQNTGTGLADGQTKSDSGNIGSTINLTNPDVDKAVTVALNIAASGSSTVDLKALTDACGDAVDLANVQGIVIRNDSVESVTDVDVAGGGVNGWASGINGTINLQKGGALALFAGSGKNMATGAADKELVVSNNDAVNAAVVTLLIVGLSV